LIHAVEAQIGEGPLSKPFTVPTDRLELGFTRHDAGRLGLLDAHVVASPWASVAPAGRHAAVLSFAIAAIEQYAVRVT
jgi:hypothetical protein